MGGAQKSMLHPYEDLDLTFRELFTMAKMFADGGSFREKVDGCNLTWRFDGENFLLARNWEHFRSNGQTVQNYRDYLNGHPAEAQFTRAMDRLESLKEAFIASGINSDIDDDVYFNMEIIDKKDPQMLKYDIDCFVIHNLCRFREEPKPHVEYVESPMCLHRLSDILSLSGVKVIHSPIVEVPPLPSQVYRQFQYTILDSMQQTQLGLDDTLRDWVERSVLESLQMHGINYEDAVLLAQNVCGKGKHDIRKIRINYDERTQEEINSMCLSSNRIKVTNGCLAQIKHAWLCFGAVRLEGVKSTLILNGEKAKKRIDDMIDFNVEVVNENRNAKKSIYEGFYNQFENFVMLDVEPQIIEGFVFETETRIFKLTGAFQSLNRICGTARYQFGQLFPEE
tara:strand:+ start:1571 stop:2755 length:1185 start_codon:yes stop_codon:yes gene_type:complete